MLFLARKMFKWSSLVRFPPPGKKIPTPTKLPIPPSGGFPTPNP